MLIDTHCHLDFKDFDPDRDDVIDRALKAGVKKIINIGSSIEGTRRSVELAKRHEMVYTTLGVHPHDAKTVTDKVIEEFRSLAKEPRVVAIGEVGLDYYRNLSPKEDQISAFRKFISLASELDLPLVLHGREADDDMLSILRATSHPGLQGTRAGAGERRVTGVMHCFSGDADFLKECLGLGLYVSFTCNLTFKNAKDLREVAKAVPVERLLLETDAPYLAPQALRGRRNEPANLTYLIEEWSKILGLSKEDIARITTHNANRLFKLDIVESSQITYNIRDSLYLNITNRCTNACDFCIRNQTSFVKGHNLRLEREPSADELIKVVNDPKKYKEIVFCGYGEPTLRLDVIKAVAGELKKKGAKIRVVTNGHGDLIHGRRIAKELSGVVDRVSVSLNADTKEIYDKFCKPEFPAAYEAIKAFTKDCVAHGIEVEMTCLDLPGTDAKKCAAIARSLGANFRPRSLGIVG